MLMRNVHKVSAGSEPDAALIREYARLPGGYVDCFYADVGGRVTLSDYIEAFFSTPVFRAERLMLNLTANGRSNRQSASELASGSSDKMAIWTTQARDDAQILMIAGNGPVFTWLMVEEAQTDAFSSRLYFGSAVLPTATGKDGTPKMAAGFRVFLGLHIFYSRLLLWWAARDLDRKVSRGGGVSVR